jgi:predicted glycosyltransferase
MAAECGSPFSWIDIDNPPQVQFFFPFVDAFRVRGWPVSLTVRDYGNALELLALRTASFHTVGKELDPRRSPKWRA